VSNVDEDDSGVRKLIMPAGTGHIARQTITGGIKSRLGHSGAVKSRLGLQAGGGGYEEEYDSEENVLRKSAIKTLDLRGRIEVSRTGERRVVETDDPDDEDLEDEEGDSYETRKLKIMKRKEKIQKLLKKQEMDKLLHKAEKKAKKKEKERLKSQVTAVNKVSKVRTVKERLSPHQDLPSASDYSDLEVDGSIDVISKTDRQGTLQSDLTLVRQVQSSEYINTSFSVRAMRAFKTRQDVFHLFFTKQKIIEIA